MKRFIKSMLGVTLLEIMLVLAIAAMIIVMSVRYYQSATGSQQANLALQQIQGYIAAADSLAAGGTYANITSAAVKSVVGTANYGPPATLTAITNQGPQGFTLKVTLSPTTLCEQVKTQVQNSFGKRASPSNCTAGSGALDITYTLAPAA